MKRFGINVPDDVYLRIVRIARRELRSIAKVMVRILDEGSKEDDLAPDSDPAAHPSSMAAPGGVRRA